MNFETENYRIRLSVIAIALVALISFAFRSAYSSGDPADVLLVLAIYGVPFLVFAFVIWSGKGRKRFEPIEQLSFRNRVAVASEYMVGASAGLLLLLLPFWSVAVVTT